jgi:hypothetical protein
VIVEVYEMQNGCRSYESVTIGSKFILCVLLELGRPG